MEVLLLLYVFFGGSISRNANLRQDKKKIGQVTFSKSQIFRINTYLLIKYLGIYVFK